MADTILFAGPSAFGLPSAVIEQSGARWLPPVRRGDVQRVVDQSPDPGVLIVCDGVFHNAPAVSHAELCRALDAGWQVWGVASLGAIRAHELRHEGMRGYGDVFDKFSQFEDFTDDEMSLLHFPDPPYFPVSEPLVNVRHALEKRGCEIGIGAMAAQTTIDELRKLWFGHRTFECIRHLLIRHASVGVAAVDELLQWLESNRLKTTDLRRLLEEQPWLTPTSPARRP